MTSGGDSVSTLPWPTLNDRPWARQWYITCSASRRAGHATARELDAEQQADAAHVRRPARWRRFISRIRSQRASAQVARTLEQPLVLDHLERRERGRAADRALLVRVVAERPVGGDVEVAARDQRRHREHGAPEPFAEDDHVGNDPVVLEREHPAGAAEADRHLVEDQQRAVTVARVADDPVVLGRRNLHVGAADRLDDHGADVLFLAEHVVDVLGALARCRRRRSQSGTPPDRRAARARCPAAAARCSCERRASPPIEIASSDAPWKLSHSDSVLWRPVARRASFSAMPIASVPPGANSTLPSGSGASVGKLCGQVDGRRIGEAPRRERERVELSPDGCHHVRVPIADLVHVVAVEVHHAAAFDVGQPDAVAGGERVEAGRGQRLMQENIRIGVEQRAGARMHVRGFELAPQRRRVDVAFGGSIGRRPRIVH